MGRIYEYKCDVTGCGKTAKSDSEYQLPKDWKEVRVTTGTGDSEDALNESDKPITICPDHRIKYTVKGND